jgi:hypothetical protein
MISPHDTPVLEKSKTLVKITPIMKNFLFFIFTIACLSLLTGCSTFAKRAEEKAVVFNALSPDAQQRLKDGQIQIGDSPDMVYIAFGNPDYKTRRVDADKQSEIWSYTGYYSRYRGQYISRYETRYAYDSKGNRYIAYTMPVWDSYYDNIPYLVRRFTFVDEKVTEIVE